MLEQRQKNQPTDEDEIQVELNYHIILNNVKYIV